MTDEASLIEIKYILKLHTEDPMETISFCQLGEH